jgi:glycosyltransferase involved in cell wall biosynthesis
MKILISAYSCDPTAGGESGNGYNWAYNNALLGHDVWCLTTVDSRASIENYEATHANNHAKINFVYIDVPNWVKYMYRYQPGVYLRYMVWQHNAYKVAKGLDKKINFDIIHHVSWGSLQLGTALWRLNKPLVFGPTGGGQFAPPAFKKYFLQWWKQETMRLWTSKILLAVNPNVRETVKRAKVVFATNQETFNMAKELGALRVELLLDTSLPTEFYAPTFPTRSESSVLRILWVGRLFARKGLPLVIEALSKVKPEIPFRLTILGDGPLGKYVPEWIKEYNLEDKIDWKGQVSWNQVKQGYLTHDVFMFCSLRDSSAAQFLEAMAFGLPIITLNIHGARNLVPDNGGIKVSANEPSKTITELANAVEYMYYHPDERINFGRKGYEFSKTQMWPIKTKHVNKFYELYSSSKIHV